MERARAGFEVMEIDTDRIPLQGGRGASGMRRSTRLELSGMEMHEVAHVHRYFAGELAQGVRHSVVTSLLSQVGHGGEMTDHMLRIPGLPKAFAPRRGGDVRGGRLDAGNGL